MRRLGTAVVTVGLAFAALGAAKATVGSDATDGSGPAQGAGATGAAAPDSTDVAGVSGISGHVDHSFRSRGSPASPSASQPAGHPEGMESMGGMGGRGRDDDSGRSALPDIVRAQRATARFFSVQAAKDAGYTVTFVDRLGFTCIEDLATPGHRGEGGMGVHLVNPAFIGSTDPTTPAALVYRPAKGGQLVLSALEYLVVEPQQPTTPTVFITPMMFTPAGDATVNRFMPDAFYSLHAWVWDLNPSGAFAMWNPKVHCAT